MKDETITLYVAYINGGGNFFRESNSGWIIQVADGRSVCVEPYFCRTSKGAPCIIHKRYLKNGYTKRVKENLPASIKTVWDGIRYVYGTQHVHAWDIPEEAYPVITAIINQVTK